MPTLYTYDELLLALAREAYRGAEAIDLSTTSAAATAGTSAIFADLAWGTSGATTTAFHNKYLYLRRFSGLATAGGASTITLRTSMGDLGAANVLANWKIKITAGTSSGDERTIASNTDANPTVVTVDSAWTTTPDTTSFYEIYPSSSAIASPVRTSRALTTASFAAATGTITSAPAFAGNLGSALSIGIGADFLLCGDPPSLLRNSVNRVLASLRFRSHLPVTMIPDGDMEGSYTLGTTESFTQWYGVDAPTTAAKSSTSYPFPFGRQYINVVTAATDNEGVSSATVPVDPDEVLYVACMVQKTPAATETAAFDVILYDMTNSTDLKAVTVSGQQPVMVYFQQAPASTTEEVAIRVLSNSAAATSFRVGPAMLWSSQRSRYPLDTSSVVRASDVRGLYELPIGQQVESDVYLLNEPLRPVTRVTERDDRSNLTNIVAWPLYYPMFMEVEQRWPELVYDTDTTYADKDTVVAGAMYYIEMARASRYYDSNPVLAAHHEARAKQHNRSYHRMLRSQGIDAIVFDESPPRRVMVPFR